MAYLVIQLVSVKNRDIANINYVKVYRDAYEDNIPVLLNNTNYQFGISPSSLKNSQMELSELLQYVQFVYAYAVYNYSSI